MLTKIFILCSFVPALLSAYVDEPFHQSAFIGPSHVFYGLPYGTHYVTDNFWNQKGKKLKSFNHFARDAVRIDLEYTLDERNSLFAKGGYARVQEKLHGKSQGFEDP